MKKYIFAFILILLCLIPCSCLATEQFSYSFDSQEDALMWSGGVIDESNPFESGYSIYLNNPFGEVKNKNITHVLDYSPTIRLEEGKVYTLSGYVINPITDYSSSLRARASMEPGANTIIVNIDGIGDEWGYFSTTFYAGSTGEYNLSLHFKNGNIDFGFFVDELLFEETPCTLSSLNLSGPNEILIPATGSITNYYRPFLLTSENQVVDILSSSNLHFSIPKIQGISFNSREFSLTVSSEVTTDAVLSIGCTLRNYEWLSPAFLPIELTDNMIDNSDFSSEENLWSGTSNTISKTENGNKYISVSTDNYGGYGYYTTITYENPQVLYEGTLYVIRARIKSDNPEKVSAIHAVNFAEIYDTTLYFTVTDISGEDWIDVFAAFIPENSGIYDIALNLCSQNDCTISVDDIKLSSEAPAPEYITMHAPGNIALSNTATSYPFSALLRDQLGNILPSDDVVIEISDNDGSFYFDNINNTITVYPDTTAGVYTLVATYLPDPRIKASLDVTISFDYIGDGTFENTIPNEWWMVASPYESSLYMKHDGTSTRALINCRGNYFMLLNNSYVRLVKNTPYVFNSSFSASTDCTGTLFIETLDGDMIPLSQFYIPAGATLEDRRLPELFLAEEHSTGRLFIYMESNNGKPFSLYADNLSLKTASVVAVNPYIIGTPIINSAVEAGFFLFNNVAESDDKSACFVTWYVSDSQNGTYTEVPTTGKSIYFDTTFLNKYVYCEITPVCPVTGFAGNPIRTLPFLVTYDSSESEISAFYPVLDEEIYPDIEFSDIGSHWGKDYIMLLAKCGVVNGKGNNRFKPDDKVTRAEFAKMLSIAFSVNGSTDLPLFEDVKNNSWYYDHVNALYLSGIIKGTSSSKFSPSKTITREEAAVMLVRLYEKAAKNSSPAAECNVPDKGNISSWAISSVNKAVELQIVQGTSSGKFAPKRNLTRAEAATLIVRLSEILR